MVDLVLGIIVISLVTVVFFGSVGIVEIVGKFAYKHFPAFAKFADKILED